jgi:hypothetical protein
MSKEYAKCENGFVHLVGVLTGGEFTVCGDAFEGHQMDYEGDDYTWRKVKSGPVTCLRCAKEIENCRGVKVRLSNENGEKPRTEGAESAMDV